MPEIKVFQLQERQVVAVAIENRIPGQGIEDVSGYRLDPIFTEKRNANQLEVVLANVTTGLRETPAGSLVTMENPEADQIRFSLKGAEAAAATVRQ